MICRNSLGEKLSLLGFGAMRLPTLSDGSIDESTLKEMVRYAIDNGVNYFDTAYPYHGGRSEVVLGRVLSEYPREKYFLADKYPGHQIMSSYDPREVFEDQLKKCGVDYFDFYLLHNVNEQSIKVYTDEKWGIIDYFKEQKRLGRIKHLGFSTHAYLSGLEDILDKIGEDMEFCQIQINYLDYSLQKAREKYELLTERGIPVWVMEPLRGGKLASLDDASLSVLNSAGMTDLPVSYAFRFLQSFDNIGMILSGMSNFEQVKGNVEIFKKLNPLNTTEREILLRVADGMKKAVPCTACRYCTDGCPMGLDIPLLISGYNDLSFVPGVSASIPLQYLPEDKRPHACIGCGACKAICPQSIDIPDVLGKLSGILDKLPRWDDVCREREEAQKKLNGK